MKYHNYIPIVLLVGFAVLSYFLLKPFFLPLFLGGILAYLLYPVYTFLLRGFKYKTVTALLVCVLIGLLVLIPGVFMVKVLVKESYVLFLLAKQKLAVGIFRGCTNSFCQSLVEFGKQEIISSQIKTGVKLITDWIIHKGSALLAGVPRAVLATFITFFSLFYFLRDGPAFLHWVSCVLGMHEKKYAYITQRMKETLHGIIHGYVLIGLLQGVLGALGFFLFGISSPLFWGITMAFLALLPSLGTGIIWGPAALILFLDGIFQDSQSLMLKGAGLFLYGLLIVGSIDNILRPKIIGSKAKIHPAVIFLGIMGGIYLFGPFGFIVGPLVLAMTTALIDVYVHKKIVD